MRQHSGASASAQDIEGGNVGIYARRQYVDEVIVDLRTASVELLYLADLR
jgi:hypothetical protein